MLPHQTTIPHTIRFSSAGEGARPALLERRDDVSPGGAGKIRVVTRGELNSAARAVGAQVASFLRASPAAGEQVAISTCMGNTFEFVVTFYGVAGNGIALAPLNPGSSKEEAKHSMEDVKSRALVIEESTINSAAREAAMELNLPILILDRTTFCAHLLTNSSRRPLSSFTPRAQDVEVWGEDGLSCRPHHVALYLHTSGTTSKPKLVPLTHHNMMTSIRNIRGTYGLTFTDVSYLVMPLFHIHGLQCGLFAALSGGGAVAFPRGGKFTAAAFWRDVLDFRATWYTAVPTIHQILLARREQDNALVREAVLERRQIRFVRSCSSPLAPATLAAVEEMLGGVKVLEAYAMTEAAHQMTSNPLPKHGPRKPGSVGRATNVELAILVESNDSTLREASRAGEVGEICIRGENVMLGYVNRPEANRESFTPQNWFKTGDQGYLDADGYLFIAGRLKEIVNRGGEKISPNEIDQLLLQNELVAEAVCFGYPSSKYGEELGAAVVLSAKGREEGITERTLRDYLTSRLSKEKIPSKIFLLEAIPKTPSGKVSRKLVGEFFHSRSML